MNTGATGGNRFEDEFTESDLSIVNLGYWDPGSDTEIASDAGQEGTASDADAPEPNDTVQTPPQSKRLTVSSLPAKDTNKTPSGQRAPRRPSGRTMGAAAVDAEDEFSRVERIPGGVKAAIEAVLAVADAPVSVRELSAALIVNERAVEAALDELYREYNGDESDYGDDGPSREPRGFELRRVGGGWRLYSRADFAPWVARFVTRSQSATLSKSAFETLAVIAYQQPVTRARVAAVRGVMPRCGSWCTASWCVRLVRKKVQGRPCMRRLSFCWRNWGWTRWMSCRSLPRFCRMIRRRHFWQMMRRYL